MIETGEITIQKAIIHVLDDRDPDSRAEDGTPLNPVFSGAALTLDREIRKYLTGYVRRAIADKSTFTANFDSTVLGKEDVRRACYSMLGSGNFVKQSSTVADLLVNAMQRKTGGDRRITPGSLIVCRFEGTKKRFPMLALLKVDRVKVLLQSIEDKTVSVKLNADALAPIRERREDWALHKAAVVWPDKKQDYHLLLLDTQSTGLPARFFATDFLGAKPHIDSLTATRRTHQALVKKTHDLRKRPESDPAHLTRKQADGMLDVARKIIAETHVDIEALVLKQRIPKAAKAEYVAAHKKTDLPVSMDIDERYIQSATTAKARATGKFGFKMEMNAGAKTRIVKKERNSDGGEVTTLEIKVQDFKWES